MDLILYILFHHIFYYYFPLSKIPSTLHNKLPVSESYNSILKHVGA